jgi:DNA-directed RNA polymerase subunit E'/Rpb7
LQLTSLANGSIYYLALFSQSLASSPILPHRLVLTFEIFLPLQQELGKATEQAIANVLEKTFINRVMQDVGLIVTLYDIIEIGEGAVYHSDGGTHYRVTFRAVVFRPFAGELLVGVVKEMTE